MPQEWYCGQWQQPRLKTKKNKIYWKVSSSTGAMLPRPGVEAWPRLRAIVVGRIPEKQEKCFINLLEATSSPDIMNNNWPFLYCWLHMPESWIVWQGYVYLCKKLPSYFLSPLPVKGNFCISTAYLTLVLVSFIYFSVDGNWVVVFYGSFKVHPPNLKHWSRFHKLGFHLHISSCDVLTVLGSDIHFLTAEFYKLLLHSL